MRVTISQIAGALLEARREGQPASLDSAALEAITHEQAWSAQQTVIDTLGGTVAGWKVAVTPDGTTIAAPIAGPLLFVDGAALPKGIYGIGGQESEVGFRIGTTLPAKAENSREEVSAAIAGACAAAEILSSRLPNGFNSPLTALLADCLGNAALVVGETTSDWQDLDFASIPLALSIGGSEAVRKDGGHVTGDPLGMVVALANHLGARGMPLEAGQYVITGSYTGVHTPAPGDTVAVSFEGLPPLSFSYETI